MKNRYYYNGELVRTSTREYTHGLVRWNGYITCHSSKEAAQKVADSEISKFNLKADEMPKIVELEKA